jgi:hypothetical protein
MTICTTDKNNVHRYCSYHFNVKNALSTEPNTSTVGVSGTRATPARQTRPDRRRRRPAWGTSAHPRGICPCRTPARAASVRSWCAPRTRASRRARSPPRCAPWRPSRSSCGPRTRACPRRRSAPSTRTSPARSAARARSPTSGGAGRRRRRRSPRRTRAGAPAARRRRPWRRVWQRGVVEQVVVVGDLWRGASLGISHGCDFCSGI